MLTRQLHRLLGCNKLCRTVFNSSNCHRTLGSDKYRQQSPPVLHKVGLLFNYKPQLRHFTMSSADSERVQVPSENALGPCPAVIFGDVSSSPWAIIVIQEWWGMNQNILDTANLLSQRSKVATLVPDLYRGKVAKDREEAGHYSADLDWLGAVQDIDACARYLKSRGVKKVGATGFCQGGAVTIATAALFPSIDAAAPFYGIPRAGSLKWDVSNIKIPLQCHFGEKDDKVGFSSPSDYEALRQKLTECKANFELLTYPAGHSFANPTSPNFDKASYELSFSRMLEFFAKQLQ